MSSVFLRSSYFCGRSCVRACVSLNDGGRFRRSWASSAFWCKRVGLSWWTTRWRLLAAVTGVGSLPFYLSPCICSWCWWVIESKPKSPTDPIDRSIDASWHMMILLWLLAAWRQCAYPSFQFSLLFGKFRTRCSMSYVLICFRWCRWFSKERWTDWHIAINLILFCFWQAYQTKTDATLGQIVWVFIIYVDV